jgi:hypothetical protein
MMGKTTPEIMKSWDRRALKALDAHYESGRYYARMNSLIGIPTVVLAAAISALAFATVANGAPLWVQLLIGFLGLIQTVLASLHTWLRHSELAEKHRQAGARYAAIRRHIEQLSTGTETPGDRAVSAVRESIDAISREAPSIPAKIWLMTQTAYGGHGTAAGVVLSPEKSNGTQPVSPPDAER